METIKEAIKDSGSKREFQTGAHRDAATGKGRTDLLPLKEVAMVMQDAVIKEFADFMEDEDISHLANAIIASTETIPRFHYSSIFQELQKQGIELDGIASDIPQELQKAKLQASLAYMMLEASKLYEAGALKYGENNWQRGMPVKVYIDSGIRHYLKTIRGDSDEPHYRGFIWNTLCAMWTINHNPNACDELKVVE